jgi:hypothetical protein
MPCGGIYPITNQFSKEARLQCLHCNKLGADHMVEEWDGFLHRNCIPAYLLTDEGQIVMLHGHEVVIQELHD